MSPYNIPIYSEKWSHHVLNFCRHLRNCVYYSQKSPCCSPLALNWVSWFKINIEKCYHCCNPLLQRVSSSSDWFFLAPFYIAFLKSFSHMCAWNYLLCSFSSSCPQILLLCFIFSCLHKSLNFLCFLCMFFVRARFSQIWLQVQTCIPSSWWHHQCDKFLGCSCLILSTSEPPCQLLCGCLPNLILNQIQKKILLVKFKRCSFSSWVSSLTWFIAQPHSCVSTNNGPGMGKP